MMHSEKMAAYSSRSRRLKSSGAAWRLLGVLLAAIIFDNGPLLADVLAEETSPTEIDHDPHWAFQPAVRPAVPDAMGDPWVRSPIDAFVLAKLRDANLQPAGDADGRTQIRRLSFVLTGLPPTPEDVEQFARDSDPDAYERMVDRLLASPQFGEHLAQMWLDVVRYAETEGYEYDNYLPGLWRYRDYVIESFNEDKPYDQFLREQLAGDELDPQDPELLIAAGFHRLGAVRRNAGNQNVASSRNEVLTERTDIIGSALLGLSIGCARCHDHRFDPVPQSDYYRLQAFVAATFESNVPLASEAEQAAWTEKTDKIKAQIEKLKSKLKETKAGSEREERLAAQLAAMEEELPPPLPMICSVTNDPDERTPIHILTRGDPEHPGAEVGMRLPAVICGPDAAELTPDSPQPRRVLADQIADPRNPLTARVFVNRLWQFVMGAGLVTTPNDFGARGDPPSHPLLLDYLASEFVEGGWRIKPLVRTLVTSSTFRQASQNDDAAAFSRIDPANRLLWRYNRYRLTAAEVRDGMLAASGRLYDRMGGPSVMVEVEPDLVELLYKPSQWQVTSDRREHDRRSIYLIAKRNLRLPFMEVFDQPDLQTSCPRRESSTHPLQALELLNGRLSNDLAEALADRLEREAGADRRAAIDRAFALVLGRPPNETEHQAAEDFLKSNPLREFALALFNTNAFIYVE